MMRHKFVLQHYGHRIPLKRRRALARLDRRGTSSIIKYRNHVLGRHSRWWEAGQFELSGDFCDGQITLEPGASSSVVYVPRGLDAVRWQFFFDGPGSLLELTSVRVAYSEYIVMPELCTPYVYALPDLMIAKVRAPHQAVISIRNPTDAPVTVTYWIGELGAIQHALKRTRQERPSDGY